MGRRETLQVKRLLSSKRRSSFEIIASILEASRQSISKTQLMLRCKLSFPQMQRYLDLTIQSELISAENNGGKVSYKTTAKGRECLKAFERMRSLVA